MFADVILSPTRAYVNAEHVQGWQRYLPFVLLLGASAAMTIYYFSTVDLGWFRDRIIARMPVDKQAIAAGMLSTRLLLGSSLFGQLAKAALWITSLSGYFLVVGRLHASTHSGGGWFYFTSLSYTPLLLLLPIGITALLLTPEGLMPDQLDTTSIASLVPGACSTRLVGACNRMSILQVWPIVLQAVGLGVWLRISPFRATAIALLPTLLYFTIVLAIAGSAG